MTADYIASVEYQQREAELTRRLERRRVARERRQPASSVARTSRLHRLVGTVIVRLRALAGRQPARG